MYIGKSSNLRRRIADHRRSWGFLRKRSWLREDKPWSFCFLLTLNALEASQLEFQLIKEWMPLYNVKDNDEEEPQVIALNLQNPFPALELQMARQATGSRTLYIGPFVFLKRAYSLYQFLSSKYKLRRCNDREFQKGSKGCLYFQIKKCLGPCFRREEVEEIYKSMVAEIEAIFDGKVKGLQRDLKMLLRKAIKSLDFESAENYYRLLKTLKYFSQKQAVILPIAVDFCVSESIPLGQTILSLIFRYFRGQLLSFEMTFEEQGIKEINGEVILEDFSLNRIKSLLKLNLRLYKNILLKQNTKEVSYVKFAGNFY